MAKKTKSNASKDVQIAELKRQLSKAKLSVDKPFRTTGGILGNAVGSMFGFPNIGKSVGKYLGTGIGSIFGSGDYMLSGGAPSYNVLFNGAQIPKFDSSRQTNIVCHREYIGDISGTSAFNVQSYPLNPGMANTFPWLSSIAENYQEYRFHGLIFEFRPLITDYVTSGAPGVVVLATNYNADAAAYTTKQAMENSEFAVSVKPTCNLIHGVECAVSQTTLSQRYVRSGAPTDSSDDLRLYDWGNFMLATQGNPVQTLGELWVSYCVEFFKPTLAPESNTSGKTSHISRSSVSSANALGTVQLQSVGNLGATATGTLLSWTAQPNELYMVSFLWTSNAAQTISGFSAGATGLTATNYFMDAGSPIIDSVATLRHSTGVANDKYFVHNFYRVTSTTGPSVVSLSVSLTNVTATTTVDIIISEINSSAST